MLDLTRPGWRRTLTLAVIALHRAVYRLSGGRLLGRVAGMPVLLLTTRGRRSGRARTTPLTYFVDGDALVVVASSGGSDRPPAWSLNLEADGRAEVLRGRERTVVAARRATDDERARLWPTIVATHPGYGAYQQRTERVIPLYVLAPAAAAATTPAP